MKIETALKMIGEPETPTAPLEAFWETSLATLPSGPIPFLQPEAIENNLSLAGMEASELHCG